MAQNLGDEKNEPSLELPTLKLPGLGRRKKERRSPAEQAEHAAQAAHAEPAAPAEDTTPPDVPVGEPEPEPDPAPPPVRPAAPVQPPAAQPAPAPQAAEPIQPARALRDEGSAEGATGPARTEAPARGLRAAERSGPLLPGPVAAVITGLLVGAAGAAGTYGAMEGCEEVRGVSTCGDAPGFFILVAIVSLMVLLGSVILKALRVADTASTSFLAVGIVTVVAMLTLLDQIFSASMFVVIPLLSAAAYVLAHWVTTRFEHEDTGRRDWT